MQQSVEGSFQHQSANEENGQNHVGKEGREVNHLARRLDAFSV